MFISSKFPYKNKAEIKNLLNSKIDGFLTKEETSEIARYMYSAEDSEVILSMLKGLYTKGPKVNTTDRRLTREERNH